MANRNDERAFAPGAVSVGSACSGGAAAHPGAVLGADRLSWARWGVLFVALAALLGAWTLAGPATTTSVVVAAHDLAPGHVVTHADLRIVDVGRSHGFRSVPAGSQDVLVGTAARALIPEGTLVHPDLVVAPALAVPSGKVVVGAVLTPGAVPVAALRPGDRVVALTASAEGRGGEPRGTAAAAALGGAEVWAVEHVASPTSVDLVWVALLIDAVHQNAVAQAAAAGHLRLGLVAP